MYERQRRLVNKMIFTFAAWWMTLILIVSSVLLYSCGTKAAHKTNVTVQQDSKPQVIANVVEPMSVAVSVPAVVPAQVPDIPAEYKRTDVSSLIKIHSAEDVSRARRELIDVIWAGNGLPVNEPAYIEKDISDQRFNNVAYLRSVDKITVTMEFGLSSTIYQLNPKTSNKKVMIFHSGHSDSIFSWPQHLSMLLENGYTVIGISMPLIGTNAGSVTTKTQFGAITVDSHELMKLLVSKSGHPVHLFLDPVIVVINYLANTNSYDRIDMMGISGGGWATTMAAALDTRISNSYPIAGSYPIFLRVHGVPGDWGDWEQTATEIYSLHDYLDLYILGSSGTNRRQLQIINKDDPCCFGGTRWTTYKDKVSGTVTNIGDGGYDLYMDSTSAEHTITIPSMKEIIYQNSQT